MGKEHFVVPKEFRASLQWIRLSQLFEENRDDLWLSHEWLWRYDVIYYCYNIVNGKGYIGQTKQCLIDRWRFGNKLSHLSALEEGADNIIYRAIRKYGTSNFLIAIIERTNHTKEDLDNAEKRWISQLHTYIHDPLGWGYNMTWGGNSTSHLRDSLLKLYPETNGASPQFIEAGHQALLKKYPDTNGAPTEWVGSGREVLKAKYGMNGACPQWQKAGYEAMLKLYPDTKGIPPKLLEVERATLLSKYPDTNGAPTEWIEAGIKARKEMYPETNGASPQWIEAGRKALKEMYPDTNGAHPNAIEAFTKAGNERRKELYPDTNGAPPQCIKAWNEAGLRTLKELYPDTNGAPPQWTSAGHAPETYKKKSITRIFSSILLTLNKIKENNKELTYENYCDYRVDSRISTITDYLIELVHDPRWTDEMTQIFKERFPELNDIETYKKEHPLPNA